MQVYGTAGLSLGFLKAESTLGASDGKSLAGWTAGEYRHSAYGTSDVTFAAVGQGDVNLETDYVWLRVSIPLD
jgi:hypothetical protein